MEMIPNLDRYWAKANPAYAGASDWHHFAYHSLDIVAVTAPLWDRSSAIRRAFGNAFSASSVNNTAEYVHGYCSSSRSTTSFRFQSLPMDPALHPINPLRPDQRLGGRSKCEPLPAQIKLRLTTLRAQALPFEQAHVIDSWGIAWGIGLALILAQQHRKRLAYSKRQDPETIQALPRLDAGKLRAQTGHLLMALF